MHLRKNIRNFRIVLFENFGQPLKVDHFLPKCRNFREFSVPFDDWKFRNFEPEFLSKWIAPNIAQKDDINSCNSCNDYNIFWRRSRASCSEVSAEAKGIRCLNSQSGRAFNAIHCFSIYYILCCPWPTISYSQRLDVSAHAIFLFPR